MNCKTNLCITGDLTLKRSLKADLANQYIVQLEVYDTGEPLRRDITNITVSINTSPPCITDTSNTCTDWEDTVTIPETQQGGISFYTVSSCVFGDVNTCSSTTWNMQFCYALI